ncbi:MAG: hypothetical protein KGR22_05450 [Planctomycetes bacterium]|nr:hypothetical protein [Planctomycetota bacterium]
MSPALLPALIALGTTVLTLVLCVALLPAPMAAFWGIPAAVLSGVWIWAGLASAKASARHASSASAVISGVGAWQIIVLVIVTSLLCGAAGFALPGGNRAPDIIGAVIIVAGCVYWGLGSAAVSLNEQRIAEAERPAMEVRAEHRQQSRIAFSCLGRVNALRPNEAECKLAIDRLARKIRTIELALAHSHGGGVGSLDRGPEHSFTDTERMVIMQAVAALEDSIRSLEAVVDSPDEIARAMGHALSIERLLAMKGML